MTKPARDWEKDWQMCNNTTPGKWVFLYYANVVYAQNGGFDDFKTVAKVKNEADGIFIAEAHEALPYWLHRAKELEEALELAYKALTEGMADVPAEERDSQCAKLRLKAKKAIRRVLGGSKNEGV